MRSSAASAARRVLAVDVVDPETGEVIAEAGQTLTDTLIKKLRKAEVIKVQVFVASGRAESTLIKNTLRKDPTHTEEEALKQIYSLLRPGDAPNLRDGAAGARAAVLLAEALRPRPRRPLQDQPAARPRTRRASDDGAHRRRTSSRSSATSSSCTRDAATRTTSTTSATGASARSAS